MADESKGAVPKVKKNLEKRIKSPNVNTLAAPVQRKGILETLIKTKGLVVTGYNAELPDSEEMMENRITPKKEIISAEKIKEILEKEEGQESEEEIPGSRKGIPENGMKMQNKEKVKFPKAKSLPEMKESSSETTDGDITDIESEISEETELEPVLSQEEFERQLNEVLRKAVLNVLDRKPKDPIRFLKHYFASEGMTDVIKKNAKSFKELTIVHPAVQERMLRYYEELSSINDADSLKVDVYQQFIKLATNDMPSEMAEILHLYLENRENKGFISISEFKFGVFMMLLFKQFLTEIEKVFKKNESIIRTEKTPPNISDFVLHQIRDCLHETLDYLDLPSFDYHDPPIILDSSDTPRYFPNSLKIEEICPQECTLEEPELSRNDRSNFTFIYEFLAKAVEMFFTEIPAFVEDRLHL